MIKISPVFENAPSEIRTALENETYKKLTELEIAFTRVDNDAVESMEDCVEISAVLGAEIRKSVFLTNRQKTELYLLIMPANKPFVTKAFSEQMGCPRMSFASSEQMMNHLGLSPGAATVMGLMNDHTGGVQLVIDQDVIDDEWFACNPGANTSHIRMRTTDLIHVLLPNLKHPPKMITL